MYVIGWQSLRNRPRLIDAALDEPVQSTIRAYPQRSLMILRQRPNRSRGHASHRHEAVPVIARQPRAQRADPYVAVLVGKHWPGFVRRKALIHRIRNRSPIQELIQPV